MMREYLLFHMTALFAGVIIDILAGDPHYLPHPIRAIGKLIAALERALYKADNDRSNIIRGALLWVVTVAVTAAVSAAVLILSYSLNKYAGFAAETVMVFYIMAAGSLRDESMKVYGKLEAGDTEGARQCLSMIVGRDTQKLDTAGITRAAVETVAENTSDGVIAPLLYTAFFGPVGGFIYKAVNTMDSMIGYNDRRYGCFGKFAARADDVLNFAPSRISALLMIAGSAVCSAFARIRSGENKSMYSASSAYTIWRRDRYNHKSPNSAQTESVCAGALGVRLGGDSSYNGVMVHKPYIGDDMRPVEAEDIRRAIRLMFVTEVVCTAVIFITTALISIFP